MPLLNTQLPVYHLHVRGPWPLGAACCPRPVAADTARPPAFFSAKRWCPRQRMPATAAAFVPSTTGSGARPAAHTTTASPTTPTATFSEPASDAQRAASRATPTSLTPPPFSSGGCWRCSDCAIYQDTFDYGPCPAHCEEERKFSAKKRDGMQPSAFHALTAPGPLRHRSDANVPRRFDHLCHGLEPGGVVDLLLCTCAAAWR